MTPNQFEFADRLSNDSQLMESVCERYAYLLVSRMSAEELKQFAVTTFKQDSLDGGADLLLEDIVREDPEWLISEYGVGII